MPPVANPETASARIMVIRMVNMKKFICITRAWLVPAIVGAGFLVGAAGLQAGDLVPFKATCYGTSLVPLALWWSQPGEVVAEVCGEATHLGSFTGTLSAKVYPCLELELTAANGDVLCAHVTSTMTGGVVTITGGTGRFANAWGGWTSTITGPTPEGWTEVAVGEISPVGSNK